MGIEIDNRTVFAKWAPGLPKDVRSFFFKDGIIRIDGKEPKELVKNLRTADVTDVQLLLNEYRHEAMDMGRARILKICAWLSSNEQKGVPVLQEIIGNRQAYADSFRDTINRFMTSIGPRITKGFFSNKSVYIIDSAIKNQLRPVNENSGIMLHGNFFGKDASINSGVGIDHGE